MNDSAKGPAAGYLFQFEKALLLLASLDNATDSITIEKVDDIAIEDNSDKVIMVVQAKHSISPSGTAFEDTSHSLWRTLEIWINKIKDGTLHADTEFVCSTNKKIPTTSLVYYIQNENSFEEVVSKIKKLLKQQKAKNKALKLNDPKSGSSVRQTVKYITYVLKNITEFEIIKKNIKISCDEEIKQKFITKIHMNSDLKTDIQRDNLYEAFCGWITSTSKAKWMNSEVASFSKKDFDTKMVLIQSQHSIINAIFRTRNELRSLDNREIDETRKELFVRQIEDISRNQSAKERKIKAAIQDYIYADIEIKSIVDVGNYTKEDFEKFLDECYNKWQECYDNIVLKNLDEYEDPAKNEIAIKIFDTIMDNIEVKFNTEFAFTTANKYVKNGSFLKLSNVPKIGWHPEWEMKYKNTL